MKRLWSVAGGLLGLLALGALVVALALTFGGLRRGAKPASRAIQSPVGTPTSTPAPPSPVENIRIARRYPLEVEGKVLEGNPWGTYPAPLFSPDGTMMLFRKRVIGGAELWRTDSQGKRGKKLLGDVWKYAWSPDGKWIAYTQPLPQGKGASLWVMKADGSEKREVAERLKTGQVYWSGESRLVYMAPDGAIMRVSLDGTQLRQLVPPLIPSASRFALSPEGDRMALANEAEVWLVDLEKPEQPMSITPYNGAFWGSIAWSPDGSKVAYSSRHSVFIVSEDGKLIAEVKTAWEPRDLAWSPDGKVLAFIGRTEERGFSFEIYLADAEGMEVKQLTDDREENVAGGTKYSLAWAPDGSKLVYGTSQLPGQKVQVIEITTKEQGEGEQKEGPIAESERQISHPFALSVSSGRTPALSDCPYQEGNDGTIWVYRQEHDSEFPPRTRQIPFEIGVYQEDPTWSNYLAACRSKNHGTQICRINTDFLMIFA